MEIVKKVYRLPEVLVMYGISKPTVYRLIAQGRFPRPVQLSKRAVGWLDSSLREYDKTLQEGVL